MTDSARPLYDCPEPCACYAEGYVQGKETLNDLMGKLDEKEQVT